MTIIFLHGWGHNKTMMEPIAGLFSKQHDCHCLNLPGFGDTQEPADVWGSDDYADYVAQWMGQHNIQDAVFVGHSMGGKISMQMALRHPERVKGMVLIATNGVPRKRSVLFKIKAFVLKMMAKMAGWTDRVLNTRLKSAYGDRFGSADYRNAKGIMRSILVKTIREDLSADLPQIDVPSLLIYGENDTATPPEMGKEIHSLVRGSVYIELPRENHVSILGSGRPQVQNQIAQFLKTLEGNA